jgi:hypothetical protein
MHSVKELRDVKVELATQIAFDKKSEKPEGMQADC